MSDSNQQHVLGEAPLRPDDQRGNEPEKKAADDASAAPMSPREITERKLSETKELRATLHEQLQNMGKQTAAIGWAAVLILGYYLAQQTIGIYDFSASARMALKFGVCGLLIYIICLCFYMMLRGFNYQKHIVSRYAHIRSFDGALQNLLDEAEYQLQASKDEVSVARRLLFWIWLASFATSGLIAFNILKHDAAGVLVLISLTYGFFQYSRLRLLQKTESRFSHLKENLEKGIRNEKGIKLSIFLFLAMAIVGLIWFIASFASKAICA